MTRQLLLPLCFAVGFSLPIVRPFSSEPWPGHIDLVWEVGSNSQWCAGIVRSNGVEIMRRWSLTNRVTLSNLFLPLDQYQFSAITTNALTGDTLESTNPAILKWVTVTNQWSTNLIDWRDLATNSFAPMWPKEFFRTTISNFDASSLLQPD